MHTTAEKLSVRVPKNGRIRVSTGKCENPGEYREKVESVRVPRNFPDEYRKMVESGSVPENDRIRVSTGKRLNPCEYGETFQKSTGKR